VLGIPVEDLEPSWRFTIYRVYTRYPLVNIQKATWKMAIEIVDLPMKNGGSFHGYVSLPEGIWHENP